MDPGGGIYFNDIANIYTNQGICKYELYVVYSNGDEIILTTFKKDNAKTTYYFQVDYNVICFNNIPGSLLFGMVKYEDGYFLGTRISGENMGKLYFRDNNRPEGQQESEDIRMRIVVDGETTIRPGDDILLRFGVSGLPEFDKNVPEGEFMAIYNKKMLWRANLYIDDRYREFDQSLDPARVDWNTANPWNDPVNNEWQEYIDYTDPLNPGNQLNSNGVQIPFLSWTHPDVEFSAGGKNWQTYVGPIYSGVAYSWDNFGLTESGFFEFNRRMSQQAIAAKDEPGANQEDPTLAPNGIWLDYDHNSYMPALGIYNHVEKTDGSPDLDAPDAGLNCTQFILHAKTYTIGQIYKEGTLFDADNLKDPANSFNLVGKPFDVRGEGVHGDINLLIPGDIIRCGTGGHWAIVQSITYNSQQERETANGLISVIHAATYNDLWAVQKGETLATFDGDYTHTYLLRPAIK